jgi:hypothetical protein
MSEPTNGGLLPRRSFWRFSLRDILWLVVVLAVTLSCWVQTRRLRDAEVALARNSWAYGNDPIPAGRFRLLVNRLIDNEDIKVVVIRFEANEEHFVTVDGAGTRTSPNEDGTTHWSEVRVVAAFDSMANHLITLTQAKSDAGTAGGRTIYPLRQGQSPKDFMAINVKPGLYELQQAVELFKKPEGIVTLTVK